MFERRCCPVCDCANESSEVLGSVPFTHKCLRDELHPKASKALANREFTVIRCQSCGLVYQVVAWEEPEAEWVYTRFSESGDLEKFRPVQHFAHKAEDAMIVRLLFPEIRPKVLDYGMGLGEWARMATAFGCEVFGFDQDPRSVAFSERYGVRFLRPEQFPESAFDFVNADQVVEHFQDPVAHLQEMVRALKPGGVMKLSTPGDRQIWRKMRALELGQIAPSAFHEAFASIAPLMHLNLFDEQSMVALGRRVGQERFHLPLSLSYASMALFDGGRQFNRNLRTPWKRSRAKGTWQYYRKPG
ncbi:MAG: class I SAM-dependent methyltransferase [Verrucomicrobiota bacterium]